MTEKEFTYKSRDGVTDIHAIAWMPDTEVTAVLQIAHGMVEHIDRYDEFASWLADKGIAVVGNDHLGHGASIQSEEDYGYFHHPKGNQYVLGDMHQLFLYTRHQYPDVPYFMLGHSMGSFLVRQYITMTSKGISGVIIMGTGYQPRYMLDMGQALCRIIAACKGWHYRSKLVNDLSFGSYNQKFEPGESGLEWLNSNEERRQKYIDDPLSGFTFTVNGYYQMFAGMKTLTDKKRLAAMDRSLPVLFVSGAEDAVGDFGDGVRKVYGQFLDLGMEHVDMKLYPGDRHEILNETDRYQVYEDLYRWMEEQS